MNAAFWIVQILLALAEVLQGIMHIEPEVTYNNNALWIYGLVEVLCFLYMILGERRPVLIKTFLFTAIGVGALAAIVATTSDGSMFVWFMRGFVWSLPWIALILGAINGDRNSKFIYEK